jgi:hypothetical protein
LDMLMVVIGAALVLWGSWLIDPVVFIIVLGVGLAWLGVRDARTRPTNR